VYHAKVRRLMCRPWMLIVALAIGWSALACAAFGEAVQVQSDSALGNKDPEKAETAIGDLVADAVRRELRTDIAFIAASELKPKDPPFPPGKIYSTDIAGLVSYSDDPLAILQLTGKEIKQALERSVSIYPQPNLGFLHVSGLKYTLTPSKPAGERITAIVVGSSPIADDTSYTVGLSNSMANGALGYWKVWSENQVKERRPNSTIPAAIESYFRANPKIDYSTLDRLAVNK
jgi:hypothetical protein